MIVAMVAADSGSSLLSVLALAVAGLSLLVTVILGLRFNAALHNARVSVIQQQHAALASHHGKLVADKNLAKLFHNALDDPSRLFRGADPADATACVQVFYLIAEHIGIYEMLYLQTRASRWVTKAFASRAGWWWRREGAPLEQWLEVPRAYLQTPLYELYWKADKLTWARRFVEFIEEGDPRWDVTPRASNGALSASESNPTILGTELQRFIRSCREYPGRRDW